MAEEEPTTRRGKREQLRALQDSINALESVTNRLTEYDDKFGKNPAQPLTGEQLKQREKERQEKEDYDRGMRRNRPAPSVPQSAQLGKGYNPEGDGKGRFKRTKKAFNFVRNRRRQFIAGGAVTGIVGSVLGLMTGLLPFQLNHLMQNIDDRAFARLNGIGVEGRSSKWIQAYMAARLLDIDNSSSNNRSNDNVLFRAGRVDNNKPFTDWYRTLRTSRFETDVFEKRGFVFSSSFYHDGTQIKVRPAKISVKDTPLTFDPFDGPDRIDPAVLERAMNGDPSAFSEIDRLTGKMDEFIHTEFFDSNKAARQELIQIMRELLPTEGWKIWNAVKRYHIRKDIQNMTGITDWKFFETSREKWAEKRIAARNKMLDKFLPQNLKSGKFLRCLFGVDECRASSDPADPANRNLPPTGERNPGRTDPNGNPVGDGSGPDTASRGATAAAAAAGDAAKKIAQQLIAKANLATGVVSLLDSLAKFDANMSNGSASKMVTAARGQQAAALFTGFMIARDQLKTGQVVPDEVDDTMSMVANTTYNEAWSTVMEERPNVIHAQTAQPRPIMPAIDKKQFCSEEYQESMKRPENREVGENQFQYLCDSQKIGARSMATSFEESWNSTLGVILHPILTAYRATVGFVIDIFNSVIDAILGPIMTAILEGLGLQAKIEEFMGWAMDRVLQFSGAGPMWNSFTPSGSIVNIAIQGGGFTAEAGSRFQGAASTTDASRAEAVKRYYAYEQEQRSRMSMYDRYLSLDNGKSVAANALAHLRSRPLTSAAPNILESMGKIFTLPLGLFSKTTSAASGSDPYATANLAGIETFDWPKECLDAPVFTMTPASATNADDLGIVDAEDLNWDLIRNKDMWFAKLYEEEDDETKVKQVWNCALLDNSVAGGIGGLYGYKGVGALSTSNAVRKLENNE